MIAGPEEQTECSSAEIPSKCQVGVLARCSSTRHLCGYRVLLGSRGKPFLSVADYIFKTLLDIRLWLGFYD